MASYLAAIDGTTLLVIDLGGQDGVIFVLPFLMFVFLPALGEDYNIRVMTRIREEAQNLPLREAVTAAIARTGPAVTSAGLILAGTFGVYAVAGGAAMGGQLQAIGLGSRWASCWTLSWSGRCSCRPPPSCSAAGTGGRHG